MDKITVGKLFELYLDTLKLDGTAQWDVISFKNSESWDEIIKLSDRIKRIIEEKWTEEDILKIYQL